MIPRPDWKDIENRSQRLGRKHIGERIAIHSSRKIDLAEFEKARDFCKERGLSWPADDYRLFWSGFVLGSVLLTNVVRSHGSRWFVGEFGLVLAAPRPLLSPIPAKGQLGFWNWEGEC